MHLTLIISFLLAFTSIAQPSSFDTNNGCKAIFYGAALKKKPAPLSGKWEFYWEKFYSPNDFRSGSISPDTLIDLPGLWKGMIIRGKPLSREGFATLRFKVKMDTIINEPLAFKISRWSNPFILYVDDKKIVSIGTIGTSHESEIYDSRPQVVEFRPSADSFEILIQTSNFRGKKAACTYPIYLGFEKQLQQQRESSNALIFIILGAIVVIGLCLILSFFSVKPPHHALLYLGLACISVSIRLLFMGEALINDLLPNLSLLLKFKIELTVLYSFVIFINLYGRAIFPDELKSWVIRIILIPHVIFILITLLFNYDIALLTQTPHHILTLIDGIYILIVLGRTVEIRRGVAIIFIASLVVFFISAVHDMLVFHHIIDTPYMIHFGFLGFMVIQTLLVTYIYSKSTGNTSILTEKLDAASKEILRLKSEPVIEGPVNIEPFCLHYKITNRERDVIQLLLSGASNNEIANTLFISFHTVRRHLNNIHRKCTISERSDLLEAIKNFTPNLNN